MARTLGVAELHKAGKIIFKEGTFGDGTYVIIEGQIEISKIIHGNKINIATLKKGDVFGEMAYLDMSPRSASAIAVTDVKIALMDREFLDEEINKTAENFRVIIKALVERLRTTTLELVSLKEQCAKHNTKP